MIYVTKPFLPPLEDYCELLEGIWENQWLTNMGPLACKLEEALKGHLQVNHLLFLTNGTIALQLAIKALELCGEIITTPYSYVATTSSIIWQDCTPVFVDIDPRSLNIDPALIEAAITEHTTAILATHVFGNPCDTIAIQRIADKHGLKVIYDGAHAFGVKLQGSSIFHQGDIATCSLHATKVYHCGEGGLAISNDPVLLKKISFARNFGHDGPGKFNGLGINGKNSEFHAALGLANLKYMQGILAHRKALTARYDEKLKDFGAIKPAWHPESESNYGYYPLIFEEEALLLACIYALVKQNIQGKRYFYPSLPQSLPYVASMDLEVTDDLSKRIYCLPLYYDLQFADVDRICDILMKTQAAIV